VGDRRPGRSSAARDAACGGSGASINAGSTVCRSAPMGIVVIIGFLAVMAALNRIEFGRFD